MLTILSFVGKVLTSPFRLLWRMYHSLYWAFDDRPRGRDQAPNRSSPTPQTPPTGLLRVGFAAASAVSTLAAIAAIALAQSGRATTIGGILLWSWATLFAQVAAVLLVRRTHRRRSAASEQSGKNSGVGPESPAAAANLPTPAGPGTAPVPRSLWATCRTQGRAIAGRCAHAAREHGPGVIAAAGRCGRIALTRTIQLVRPTRPRPAA